MIDPARDPLKQLFYLLMRDHLPTGKVEEAMLQVRQCRGKFLQYSAPHLEAYAAELAAEIRELETAPPQQPGAKLAGVTGPPVGEGTKG